jgi:hypothetical protein
MIRAAILLILASFLLPACGPPGLPSERTSKAAETWLIRKDRNDKYGFVDQNGHVMIEPIYDDVLPFYHGHSVVIINYETMMIDVHGRVVTPKYDEIEPFKGHLAAHAILDTVIQGEQQYSHCLIDTAGRRLTPLVERIEFEKKIGMYRLQMPCEDTRERHCYSLASLDGKVWQESYPKIDFWEWDTVVVAALSTQYGDERDILLNLQGDSVSATYSDIKRLDIPGFYAARKLGTKLSDGQYGMIDSKGQLLLHQNYQRIVFDRWKQCFIATVNPANSKGDELKEVYTRSMKPLSSRPAIVEFPEEGPLVALTTADMEYAFYRVDSNEWRQVSPVYRKRFREESGTRRVLIFFKQNYHYVWKEIPPFACHRARVERGRKFGYIDPQGKEVIPVKYDEADWVFDDKNGCRCKVRLGKEELEVDTAGQQVGIQ